MQVEEKRHRWSRKRRKGRILREGREDDHFP
jgi:hypothetical protein